MKKAISPVLTAVILTVVVFVVAALVWNGTQRHDRLPDKPPSGPIPLPPSQQGRRLPGGTFSGAVPDASGSGK
jgi:flagellin-like protein